MLDELADDLLEVARFLQVLETAEAADDALADAAVVAVVLDDVQVAVGAGGGADGLGSDEHSTTHCDGRIATIKRTRALQRSYVQESGARIALHFCG